ncbi:potassium transporter Trk [Halobacteriales archaeon SW_5_70_135]|nr:MAG: potassium transporter Trk [Halobacteriales archaeon SW_5_70_135]
MRKDLRVVIVGGSHVGYHTAVRLNNRGHNVTVVEKDEDRVEFLNDQYVATVIHGQGGRPSVLRQTNLENSDVIAALTDYGAMTNIGICATARRIAPDVRTVARIDHGDDEGFGEMVSGGGVRTIEEVTEDLELMEVRVEADAPVAGRTLAEVSFPRGALVVTDTRTGRFPTAETTLEPGVQYVLAVRADVADEVVRLLRG